MREYHAQCLWSTPGFGRNACTQRLAPSVIAGQNTGMTFCANLRQRLFRKLGRQDRPNLTI